MKFIPFLTLCCIFVLFCLPAMAQVTMSETTSPSGNLSNFAYSIDDTGQLPIFAFSLNVNTPVTNVVAPSGWVGEADPFGDTTTINWSVSDIPFEIQPSSTLTGFGCTSTSFTGSIQYSAIDTNFNDLNGTTQGPISAAVPEASTITLLSFGLVTFGCGLGLKAWKRRKAS